MKLYKGDCLIESDKIESGSVDLILTDLPYGTMKGQSDSGIYHQGKEKHEWDNIIPTNKIMEIANRILRKNGKMILFAQEPFTNKLMNSAIPNLPFNYRAIWLKDTLGSFMRSKKALLYKTEDILLFSKIHDFEGLHPLREYFKNVLDFIGLNLKQINTKLGHRRAEHKFYVTPKEAIIKEIGQKADHVTRIGSTQFGLCTEKTYKELIKEFNIDKMEGFKEFAELKQIDTEYRTNLLKQMNDQYPSTFNLWEGKKYKSNIFKYDRSDVGHHPTQKPVLLIEDLIKTFSNENNLVVDLTMGSGSTMVACQNTNRNGIGIELDQGYFEIAQKRVAENSQRINAPNLFSTI